MLKAANVTVRVKPATRKRLETLANVTKRSQSYVIEEALELYLDVNEWQIAGILQALDEAEKAGAVLVDHDAVLAKWELKKGAHRIKWLGLALGDLDEIEAYISPQWQ